ncbi:integrin beta-PS-like [Ornithodoros turicata]|uniref:integrin beta-PS-like n=1 Tax=Ornithodoros turicata TaxID=34597 RepID=UPI003139E59E
MALLIPFLRLVVLLIPVAYALQATLPVAESLTSVSCTSHTNCSSCLTVPQCAWCGQEDFSRGNVRCNIKSDLLAKGCAEEFIESPVGRLLSIKQLEHAGSDVQLQPESVRLELRQNEPLKFDVTYRQAEDYPVEMYYLMDVTHSMKDHKVKVAELAENLMATMLEMTKQFRLGFGSFIDKVVMPYVDTTPARLENPCHGEQCEPPYGFRNNLPLTTNTTLFRDTVSSTGLSANLDNAEGGFDGIMQAIVCKEKIGWNNRSRKILLFATDSIFHYAGDGLLGGIIKRNDEECHLDEEGYYTESVHQDYPSLSQIVSAVEKNKINLVIAVPEGAYDVYRQMSQFVQGSAVGKLEGDSSNIVDLVRDQYYKIRSEVELKDTAPDFLRVSYKSRCLGKTVGLTNVCSGVKVGDQVEFGVEVEAVGCPANPNESYTFRISPVGVNEYVEVEVSVFCDCSCKDSEEVNSTRCSEHGTYSCGVCSCDTKYSGLHCECLDKDIDMHRALCQPSNSTTELCSGRGDCICGQCECHTSAAGRIFGRWCECDTFSCARDALSHVCGGDERGECCGGECLCKDGWTGSDCSCTTDTSTCVAPGEDRICSGHGECVCGACVCQADERGRYAGDFCQDCSACAGRCSEFRNCVQCSIFGSGELSEAECRHNCSELNIIEVDAAEATKPDARKCVFKDDDDCSFIFVYYYDDKNSPVIEVQTTKECGPGAYLWYIVGGVIGGILLVGLFVVCVLRFVIYLKDKMEYERFEKELESTQWGSGTNPLFKGAVSNFSNPMYEKGHSSAISTG